MTGLPQWLHDLAQLRLELGQMHEDWRNDPDYDGHCKSSEGVISISFPPWVDYYDTAEWLLQEPSCGVYSYLFGPHRNHYFKSVSEALAAVRSWRDDSYENWLGR